jgi:hypothetical protein
MNFDNIGRQIARIEGTNLTKYKDKIVYVDPNFVQNEDSSTTDTKHENYFNAMKLRSGQFMPLPNQLTYKSGKNQREIMYVCASQGSGKSTFTAKYIKEYQKQFPKNNVYVISQIEEDDAFKDIKNLKRLEIDERLISDPISYEMFENSLVIFDDVDVMSNKEIKNAVLQLRNEIAELGRHKNISMLQTSHASCNGTKTKSIIQECSCVVLFMKGGNTYNRLLKEYLGFNDPEVRALKKLNSRWVCIHKTYPSIILTENEIMTKDKFCDDVLQEKQKKN